MSKNPRHKTNDEAEKEPLTFSLAQLYKLITKGKREVNRNQNTGEEKCENVKKSSRV